MDFETFDQAIQHKRAGARTILVVDDSRTNLNVIGKRLTTAGYTVVLCDNGPEALGLIAARPFDLVLLDMMMPVMPGVRVLSEIRANRMTADLPVIMITGRSDPAAVVEALAAGADDHVAKPFAFEVLTARIERTMARARRIADLKRTTATLDARVAARAVELGEVKTELAASQADRIRLIASLQALHNEVARLSLGTNAAG
jgi:two-component system, OmpR family, response regulator